MNTQQLRDKMRTLLAPENRDGFYSHYAHEYVRYSYDNRGRLKKPIFEREILMPLTKESWPSKALQLLKLYPEEAAKNWPYMSTFCYAMDAMTEPQLPGLSLYYGYALYENKLIRCPFYITLIPINKTIEGLEISIPIEFVVDPIAEINNIHPECYIGLHIPKNFTDDWLLGDNEISPLEAYAATIKGVFFDKDEDVGVLQYSINFAELQRQLSMVITRNSLPPQLQKFAKKHGITIPQDQKFGIDETIDVD
jgi:hypothetical protein